MFAFGIAVSRIAAIEALGSVAPRARSCFLLLPAKCKNEDMTPVP